MRRDVVHLSDNWRIMGNGLGYFLQWRSPWTDHSKHTKAQTWRTHQKYSSFEEAYRASDEVVRTLTPWNMKKRL